MKVGLKNIFKSFLDNYINIHFEINKISSGFETKGSLYESHGKYSISKHSKSITKWYSYQGRKEFEEYEIEEVNGNINIVSNNGITKKILMVFTKHDEPLYI